MKTRGLGRVYQPVYKDKRTGARKTSAVWWVECSFRGKKHRESSESPDKPVAVRLLRRRLGEIARGRLAGPDLEKTTLEDLGRILLDDYRVNGRKTLKNVRGSLKALGTFFGSTSYARDITLDRLNAYVAARLAGGRKPATVHNDLAALKRAFHLAENAGKAVRPPFPTLTIRNTRTGFFEEPEFRAVWMHLPEPIRPVAEFAYLTGWRLGEVLGLEWWQVDFAVGVVRLEPGTTKNDEGRVFPFAVLPELATLLRRQREHTDVVERATGQIIKAVFHRTGRPIKDFAGAWASACIAAGFYRVDPATRKKKPTRLFHDLRRCAVRALERAGVARSVAMKLTGHKTESVYRRYAIVSESDLSEGVAKLAALRTKVTARTPVANLADTRAAAARGGQGARPRPLR